MIKGTFERDEAGRLTFFELKGHAESGPYGSDIVCAAVSALAISTVNGMEALAGFTPQIEMNDIEGGYLACTIVPGITQEQLNISQILLENFYLALEGIQAENADYIEIKTVHGGATDAKI